MKAYIFKIGKDGYLYPEINGQLLPKDLELEEFIKITKTAFCINKGIKQKDFNSQYRILIEL